MIKEKEKPVYDIASKLNISIATVSVALKDDPIVNKKKRKKVLHTEDLSHFDLFHKKNIPVIFFDRVIGGDDYTNVIIENKKAAYQATTHSIEQGCRKIVHITATPKQNVYIERLAGYKEALEDHHIKFDKKNVILNNLTLEDAVSKVIEPNLRTINYPGYEMGEVAANNLINHLKGTSNIEITNTIILKSEFIIRESSQKKKTK